MIDRLKEKKAAIEKEIAFYKEQIAKAYAKCEIIDEIIAEETPVEQTVEVYADGVCKETIEVESVPESGTL